MNTFHVNDMTCGHCAGTIRAALSALDPQATVRIDLNTRRVEIDSAQATPAQLKDALEQAGYTPVPIEAAPAASTPQGGGCCCR